MTTKQATCEKCNATFEWHYETSPKQCKQCKLAHASHLNKDINEAMKRMGLDITSI
jgi:hypothetical protein